MPFYLACESWALQALESKSLKKQHNSWKASFTHWYHIQLFYRCSSNWETTPVSCSTKAEQVRHQVVLLAEPATGNQKRKVRIEYKLTCFVVFLTLSVQPAHFLHKFPFLTASWIVDKITRKDLLQLPNTQAFDVLQTWNIRQRGSRSFSGQSGSLKHRAVCFYLSW